MTNPSPVGKELEKAARMATCKTCPAPIEQMRFLGRWAPEHCPTCAASAGARDREERALEEARVRTKLRLAALGVPKLYAGTSFETFTLHGTEEDKARQQRIVNRGRLFCTDWPEIPEEKMLVALIGGPGTGKGHWVWSVAKWIAEHHDHRVRVTRLADLIREIRATWRKGAAGDEEGVLKFYRELDLLAIDEVSRHAFYGQSTQHLFDVINDRIEQCRPTILTSNETETGLQEILGPALTDRLEGCGGLIRFGDTSWRSRERGAA